MNRRTALSLMTSASLTGVKLQARSNSASPPGGAPPDEPRTLKPTGADIGSLLPDMEHLVDRDQFPYSFLSNRFSSVEDYRKAGRDIVSEALASRSAAVPLAPQVVDRQDLGEFIREKVIFSTTPDFRVPAYVHIPKGLKGRAPAVVDLHSHGGMFLFGKEKVIDFGHNHPVMTEYIRSTTVGGQQLPSWSAVATSSSRSMR